LDYTPLKSGGMVAGKSRREHDQRSERQHDKYDPYAVPEICGYHGTTPLPSPALVVASVKEGIWAKRRNKHETNGVHPKS
jgi:hypothetical protein